MMIHKGYHGSHFDYLGHSSDKKYLYFMIKFYLIGDKTRVHIEAFPIPSTARLARDPNNSISLICFHFQMNVNHNHYLLLPS